MVISIGYAACHWCHVMEQESFEDTEVAGIMNAYFISVKVDREERPDVDQVYMYAAYAVTGRGGWPLNVIALPDGRPVYAGTYFPKGTWLSLLKELASIFRDNPSELIQQADNIHRRIQQMEAKPSHKTDNGNDLKVPGRWFDQLRSGLDFQNGGSSGEPKFPMPCLLDFIMQYAVLSGNAEARSYINITLDKIAAGGIFDHLGGGFCRYSTDDRWHIPHFEKMLYDNAQLVSLYSKAFCWSGNTGYKEIVMSTLGFIGRELTSAEGLFYSSIDADSEGKEGAFYTWKASEMEALLYPDHQAFMQYFNVSKEGNWENGENVLWIPEKKEITSLLQSQKEILFHAREKRIHPPLDNKIITSWNAMMISAYVDACRTFSDLSCLEKAIKAISILAGEVMDQHGRLQRIVKKQKTNPAFLDDYALLTKSCCDLYQATFDIQWLKMAEKLVDYTLIHFPDPGSGLFYFTSDEDPALIDRRMEFSDNVIPASNSVMAQNLFVLGHLLAKGKWISYSENMLKRMIGKISSDPAFYANWAALQLQLIIKPFEVYIVGLDWKEKIKYFHRHYLPHVIFSGGVGENDLEILKGKAVAGKTLIYICRDKTCSEPFDDAEKALEYLKEQL